LADTYYQQSGQNKRMWVRQNDTLPAAEVQLIYESDGTYHDISSGKGHIEVYKSDNTTLLSGGTLDMTDGALGKASYAWGAGELTTIGTYNLVFKIDPDNTDSYFSVPEYPYDFILRVG
jgi:hypothetical protein